VDADRAERPSTRGVLGIPEFRSLLTAASLSTLGDQVTRIAVALLVYERTGSSFLSAATMACSYLVWLALGPFLSSLADRWPRRALMVWCDAVRVVLIGCLVVPGLPIPLIFLLLCLVSLLEPPFDSARSAITPDIVPEEAFRTANALLTTSRQGCTAAGFLLGGLLCAVLSPEGALAVDAATFAGSAVLLRCRLQEHRPSREPEGGVAHETAAGFQLVLGSPRLRILLGYATLNTLALVGAEGLAVPTADALGGGGPTAGLLIATLPAGFMIGTVFVLRIPEHRRDRLLAPLTALVCAPLLLSPMVDSTATLTVLWTLAGVASASAVISNASFVLATPPHARGRAFGVALTVMLGAQGLAVLVLGWLAEVVDPRTAVSLGSAAVLALVVLLRFSEHRHEVGHMGADHPGIGDLAQDHDQIRRVAHG
jgi:MFS family permease